MSTDLAKIDSGTIETLAEGFLSPAQMQVLRNRIAPGASDEEIALFIATARELGLSPLAGQIQAIRFEQGGAITPFRTWEGLVALAEGTGEYRGMDGPMWTDDGETWHEVWLKSTDPKAAKCVVYREGWAPSVGIALISEAERVIDEWVDVKGPDGKVIWERDANGRSKPKRVKTGRKMPMAQWKRGEDGGQRIHMLGKQAVRIALKKAFPHQCDERLTPSQLKALHTLAHAMGYESRGDRLEAAGVILGHPVQSFKDLSRLEAADVLDLWGAAKDQGDPEDLRPVLEASLDEAGVDWDLADEIHDAELVEDVADAGSRAPANPPQPVGGAPPATAAQGVGGVREASPAPVRAEAISVTSLSEVGMDTEPMERLKQSTGVATATAAAGQGSLLGGGGQREVEAAPGSDTPNLETLLLRLEAWKDGPSKRGWLASLQGVVGVESPEMCNEEQAARALVFLGVAGH